MNFIERNHLRLITLLLFQNLLKCPSEPFGGKALVVGGDFRQTLPILSQDEQDLESACVFSHYLSPDFEVLYFYECKFLKTLISVVSNMTFQTSFTGITSVDEHESDQRSHLCSLGSIHWRWYRQLVRTSHQIAKTCDGKPVQYVHNMDNLIARVFGSEPPSDGSKAIRAVSNSECDDINAKVLSLIPGETREYLSSSCLVVVTRLSISDATVVSMVWQLLSEDN